jgi:hypothetical protein
MGNVSMCYITRAEEISVWSYYPFWRQSKGRSIINLAKVMEITVELVGLMTELI